MFEPNLAGSLANSVFCDERIFGRVAECEADALFPQHFFGDGSAARFFNQALKLRAVWGRAQGRFAGHGVQQPPMDSMFTQCTQAM
jgi:hypothetical protein